MKWGHPLNSAPGTANPKFSTAKYEPFCGGTATTSARGVRRRSYIDNLCRLTEIEVGSVGADDFEVANVSESRLFEYDDLGRLLKTKQSSASGGSVYGQAVYGVNAYGASGSASMEERSYVYDSLDRVQMVTFEDGKTMEYFYDFEGNVTEVVENASGTSKTTQFSYYGDNRLYQVTYVRASGNQVFTYDYDPGGRPEKLTYPASTGIVAEFEGPNGEPGWDGNGQLKHLRYMKGTDTIRRFAFEYDLAGNRISQLDVVDIAQPPTRRAVEWVYGYDWLDRLESVKKREATTVAGLALEPLQLTSMYQYDAADNRIEFKVPNLQQPELTELTETFTYSYDDADNILSISKAVGTGSANEIEAFTSDADGNLKTRTSGGVTTTYTWNDFNRLAAISTSDNSKKQSHTFGVNGFRRKKKDKNDVETTEYAAGLATAVSKAQAGDTITYLMGHRLMGFERQSDGAMFWNICDALSTVRDVVNSSGTVVASYEFSEYGQRIDSTENRVSSQKTFVGGLSVQDEVTETGLMAMGQRFYASGFLGRFISRDPIGVRGGANLFAYSNSSPISLTDPTGLRPLYLDEIDPSLVKNSNFSNLLTDEVFTKEVAGELLAELMMSKDPALAKLWAPLLAEYLNVTVAYGDSPEGNLGSAGKEGYIFLQRGMSLNLTKTALFHELLHKAQDAGTCYTTGGVTRNVGESYEAYKKRFNRDLAINHAWIYLTQSMYSGGDYSDDWKGDSMREDLIMVANFNAKHNPDGKLNNDPAYLAKIARLLGTFGRVNSSW